jgi:hypothetical protein
MKPHKHAEVIKAFIEGIECEWSAHSKGWWKIDDLDTFDWASEVRIKPEPKPDVELFSRVYNNEDGIAYLTHAIRTQHEKFNLKLTFDGETNEIKHAEVIK